MDHTYTTDELKTILRLFREFYNFYVRQTLPGANHHHPIWGMISKALEEQNSTEMTGGERLMISSPHFQYVKRGSEGLLDEE